MRALGLVGMLLALLVVGFLVKKQLGADAPPGAAVSSTQPREAQAQFKQSLDAAMQAPRAMPDEAK